MTDEDTSDSARAPERIEPPIRSACVLVGILLVASACGSALPELPQAAPGRLPFDGTYVALTAEQVRLADRLVAAVVADCMRSRGFEYVVESQSPVSTSHLPGWGISTGYGLEAGRTADGAVALPGANAAIHESLRPAEQDAYESALHGDPEDRVVLASPDGGEVSFSGPESCTGQGNAAVYGDMETLLLAQEEILLAYNDLEDRIQADPRLVSVRDAWSDCMADNGYDVESPEMASGQIGQQLTMLIEQGLVPDISALPIDEKTGTFTASSAVGPELAALQVAEVTLFDLVGECDQEVGLSDMESRVRIAYEVPFAEEHSDLVDDLQVPSLNVPR